MIFLSYRRDGGEFVVDVVFKALESEFTRDGVIMDVVSLIKGRDFREEMGKLLATCDILLALIDRDWLDAKDDHGKRKLDDPGDWVRIEIETALNRDIEVIPVLLGKATLPKAQELPQSLAALAYRQVAQVRGGRDTPRDLEDLVKDVKRCRLARQRRGDTLAEVERAWHSGDWRRATAAVQALVEETQAGTAGGLEQLRARAAVLATLCNAQKALEAGEVREAQRLLQHVDPAAGPPNVEAARVVAGALVEVPRALAQDQPEVVEAALQELKRARQAVQRAQPCVVPGEGALAALERQAATVGCYVRGQAAYEQGRYVDAAAAFASCGDLRDARDRAAASRTLDEARTLLLAGRWAEARSRLREFPLAADLPRVRALRDWCQRARFLVPALEALAAGAHVEAPVQPLVGCARPYATLGIAPDTVLEPGAEPRALRSGAPAAEVRAAWECVQRPASRLLADFHLLAVRHPARARELVGVLVPRREGVLQAPTLAPAGERHEDGGASGGPTWREVAERLGEDAGVFVALIAPHLGEHAAALEILWQDARAHPDDPTRLHHVALGALAMLQRPEPPNDEPEQALGHLVAAWGSVFADDRFWSDWGSARVRVVRAAAEQVRDARLTLLGALGELLRSTTVWGSGEERFLVERLGAEALAKVGGLPVGTGPRRVVVGCEGIRRLHLGPSLADWVASTPEAVRAGEPHLRFSMLFSELATAAALCSVGRFAEAAQAMGRTRSATVDFTAANPALARLRGSVGWLRRMEDRLGRDVHLGLLRQALEVRPLDPVPVLAAGREVARRTETGAGEGGSLGPLRAAVLARARALQEASAEGPRARLDALNDAVVLLDAVVGEGWDGADKPLTNALAEALLERAMHLSAEYDEEEQARHDALRAHAQGATSLKAHFVLGKVSLHFALQLLRKGKQAAARALIADAEKCLHRARELHPEHPFVPTLATLLKQTRDELPPQAGSPPREVPRKGPVDRIDELLTRALVHEGRGEFAQAVLALRQILEVQPANKDIQARMAWCYRRWVQHLMDSSRSPEEVVPVVQEAFERCPGSTLLEDMRFLLPDDGPNP